jgi:hypothetical protein
MLIIVWNPGNFHIVDFLPKGRKVNSNYYFSNILTLICNGFATSRTEASANFSIRGDHARSQRINCI